MKPRPLAVDPKSFERSGVLPPRIVLALASGTTAEEKPLPNIAEEPGPVNLFAPNGGYLTQSAPSGGPSSYHGLWPWLVIHSQPRAGTILPRIRRIPLVRAVPSSGA